MDSLTVNSDTEQAAALREVETLWRAAHGSEDGRSLDGLTAVVETYEDVRWSLKRTAA